MKIVSGLRFSEALSSVAEVLAAAGQDGAPGPARPFLEAQWEQEASGRLHCIWVAIPASAQPGLPPAVADRPAHLHAMGVSR